MRLGLLAVVCAVMLSGCTYGQLWGFLFVKHVSMATSYSPERAEREFRIERPKLAGVLSNNFPDRYDAVMEQISAIVMAPDGDFAAGPDLVHAEIAARFGLYAAYASDETQRVALDAIITELRLSDDQATGECMDAVIPMRLFLKRRNALDAAIIEGIEAPVERPAATGEGYPFLVLHLAQRGIGQGILQAYLAGEWVEPCTDLPTILEGINTLETRDAKAMRADILSGFAVLL